MSRVDRAGGQRRRRFAVLGAPSSAGGRKTGQELGPGALRAAGLVALLRERAGGAEVLDLGDLPSQVFAPDAAHPRCQNLAQVVEVARGVQAHLRPVVADGYFPVVLGGDCSISVGVVAALVERSPGLGLVYFDADLDLNTPETTPSGILDGMVTAHLLGRGAAELAGLGPRWPLLAPPRLLYFGYDAEGGGIDAAELHAIRRSGSPNVTSRTVRKAPVAAAGTAVERLLAEASELLIHFDVDTLDTCAVDVPHCNGLPLATAMDSLAVFLATAEAAGLVVTELNPAFDAGGATAKALAANLPLVLTGGWS